MTYLRFCTFASFLLVVLAPLRAVADEAPSTTDAAAPSAEPAVPAPPPPSERRTVALEVNVLWPFFPGGIGELRLMVPVVRTDERDFRGELVLGVYSDYASRIVRDDSHGKVANISGKIGWRQFFVYGLHAEVSANMGWRHESMRPPNNLTIDGFQIRVWTLAGYQHEFSRTIYANARAGVGLHAYRSDEYAYLEKKVAVGGDMNLGIRF